MRFATARDVQLAYPDMAMGPPAQLDDTPSHMFLERLMAEGRRADAVSFMAHLLRRREAIWWATMCVRMEPKSVNAMEQHVLAVAARWVADPNEDDRRQLLASSSGADLTRPAIWLALAVGWSGGLLRNDGMSQVMCEPYMSPAAVRAAVLLASSFAADPRAYLERCLEHGTSVLKSDKF